MICYPFILPSFLNKCTKKGKPKNAVINPTGISVGDNIVLAIMSEDNKIIAPIKEAWGIRYFGFVPQAILEICGATNPTNPIIPVCDTATEEDKVDAKISRVIVLFSFIPKDFTCFESKFNILILLCCKSSKITQGNPAKKTILKCSQDASEKPPSNQLNIGLISGFCVININVVNAPIIDVIATPANINER